MPTRNRVVPTLFGAAMLATAGLGIALAQDAPVVNNEPTEMPAVDDGAHDAADGTATPDIGPTEVPVQVEPTLSVAEQLAEAERILERGGQLSSRVATMLEEARREHEIIRTTCLNDKLTQVNANIASVTERTSDLRAAADVNDADRATHEFTVITVLGQRFRLLENESNQCVGGEVYANDGATTVETRVTPGTPTGTTPEQISNSVPPTTPYVPRPLSGGVSTS